MVGRFLRDTRGNFFMIFAMAIVPIIGVAGIALDYSRAFREKQALQHAVDAAAMTAAIEYGLSPDYRRESAQKQFTANYVRQLDHQLEVNFQGDTAETSVAVAKAEVPTSLLNIIGIEKIAVNAAAEVVTIEDPIQIALALDLTKSMNENNRIGVMKSALTDFATRMIPHANSNATVGISIVSFSDSVRVPASYRNKFWLNIDWARRNSFTGCVWDRAAPYADTAAPPKTSISASLYEPTPDIGYTQAYCDDYAEIMPISYDRNEILEKIDSLRTKSEYFLPDQSGSTNIPLGLVWAMNTLSRDEPYPNHIHNTRKVLILVTDGENSFSRLGSFVDEEGIDANTLALCNEAKAEGYEVFTMRMIDGSENILGSCASGPDHFTDITEVSDFPPAFEKLGDVLWGRRIAFSK